MRTDQAFIMGQMNQNKTRMVFDWDKAAKIIKAYQAREAGAGLRSDWEYTGGPIWANGKIVPKEDTYTYLASTWAIPEIDVDGKIMECWRYEPDTPNWDEDTYWPDSARAILTGDE